MNTWRDEVWRFGVVGAFGFLVDAAVLSWLVQGQGWGPVEGRGVSFALAVTTTWALNRRFTFAARAGADRSREYGRYLAVQTIGALINLGVYLAAIAAVPWVAAWPVLPLAAGAGVAMVFNFVGSRHLAFTGRASALTHEEG
jgi:putative flippase GtrA